MPHILSVVRALSDERVGKMTNNSNNIRLLNERIPRTTRPRELFVIIDRSRARPPDNGQPYDPYYKKCVRFEIMSPRTYFHLSLIPYPLTRSRWKHAGGRPPDNRIWRFENVLNYERNNIPYRPSGITDSY